MVIIINDETIDFTLENERTLGEVLEALESWLGRSNLIMTSARADDRDLTEQTRRQWSDLPPDQIATLNVSARLVKEVHANSLETLLQYFDLFGRALKDRDVDNLEQLLDGRSDMSLSLHTLLKPSPDTEWGRTIAELDTLLSGSTAHDVLAWPEGVAARASQLIAFVRAKLRERLTEITDPMKSLRDAAEELDSMRQELGGVSVHLQTNEEKRAMSTIISFSDLSHRILRILSYLEDSGRISLSELTIGGSNVRSFFDDLNQVLRELIEAFKMEDFVLIGDLVEYEITPRLEVFSGFTKEICCGS